MTNSQPIEKQVLDIGGSLVVHSIFDTIQGEGPFAGHAAIFIRLAGCNLQCPMCDTDYAVGSRQSVIGIIEELERFQRRKLIVITGGEPFRQNIAPLVRRLSQAGYQVQVETNGTLYVPGPWDDPRVTVVCSPKAGQVNGNLEKQIKALKYVLNAEAVDPNDGLPTSVLGRDSKVYRPNTKLERRPIVYVQPADEKDPQKNAANLAATLHSVSTFGYVLCLQLHKIIGVP